MDLEILSVIFATKEKFLEFADHTIECFSRTLKNELCSKTDVAATVFDENT